MCIFSGSYNSYSESNISAVFFFFAYILSFSINTKFHKVNCIVSDIYHNSKFLNENLLFWEIWINSLISNYLLKKNIIYTNNENWMEFSIDRSFSAIFLFFDDKTFPS